MNQQLPGPDSLVIPYLVINKNQLEGKVINHVHTCQRKSKKVFCVIIFSKGNTGDINTKASQAQVHRSSCVGVRHGPDTCCTPKRDCGNKNSRGSGEVTAGGSGKYTLRLESIF